MNQHRISQAFYEIYDKTLTPETDWSSFKLGYETGYEDARRAAETPVKRESATVPPTDERTAFEEWFEADTIPGSTGFFDRDTSQPDEYAIFEVQCEWRAWQARAMLAAAPASPAALNGIPATLRHDEGAIARCSYCGRYSIDPKTLSDRQPRCECGEKHGWSGSFTKPGHDAEWSGQAPAAESKTLPRESEGEAVMTDDTLNELYFRAQAQSRRHWVENARLILAAQPSQAQAAEAVAKPTDDMIDAARPLFLAMECGAKSIESIREYFANSEPDVLHALPEWFRTGRGHLTKAGKALVAWHAMHALTPPASPVASEREGLTKALELLDDAQSYVDAFADDPTDGHIAKDLSNRIDALLATRTGSDK
jgi:hypothetical protein